MNKITALSILEDELSEARARKACYVKELEHRRAELERQLEKLENTEQLINSLTDAIASLRP